jgi:5-methylcytosine-specific restriction enzyme subunit McrC
MEAERKIGRIPLRNIWFLFLYAADLARFHDRFQADVEESPDLPDLVARLLCHAVELRLRRNLSRGYRPRREILTRVRGRIDILQTERGRLLDRARIACRFDDHTLDTPRNRLVRAALDALASRVNTADRAHDCRALSSALGRQGVGGARPSRTELAADRIGRHDTEDRLMVTLAEFVFNLVLPTEDAGDKQIAGVHKEDRLVRGLFEKAVGNFLAAELGPAGWKVHPGQKLKWPTVDATPGLAAILPGMQTDIVLEHAGQGRRIILDTKFTGIFTRSRRRETMLKSGYVYQLYACLRSQAREDDRMSHQSEGLLLHPAIDADVDVEHPNPRPSVTFHDRGSRQHERRNSQAATRSRITPLYRENQPAMSHVTPVRQRRLRR